MSSEHHSKKKNNAAPVDDDEPSILQVHESTSSCSSAAAVAAASAAILQKEQPPSVLILHTSETADIGKWVLNTIQRRIPGLASAAQPVPDEASFHQAAISTVGNKPEQFAMVIVIFFDGTSDAAKQCFAPLKAWSSTAANSANVVVQALNSKKGQHSLFSNEDALVSSLHKKLPPGLQAASAAAAQAGGSGGGAVAAAAASQAGNKNTNSGGAAAAAAASSSSSSASAAAPIVSGVEPPPLVTRAINYEDLSLENLSGNINHGQGECVWLVVARNQTDLDVKVKALRDAAAKVECAIAPVASAPRPVDVNMLPKSQQPAAAAVAAAQPPAAAAAADAKPKKDDDGAEGSDATKDSTSSNKKPEQALAWEFLVRRASAAFHMEMRVCVCGNVDSGKSTLTSVLTKGFKDDGRGLARAKVFNHRHEEQTGRTSSISENHLGFDPVGNVVNYPPGGPTQSKHTVTAEEMFEKSAKILTLYDLAGHERYLKTTVLGMTRSAPDYAVIVISANNGIQRMTREHLGLCLALRLPFFIVVTRIDATPDTVRAETIESIKELLKMPTVRKLYYPVKSEEDAIVCSKNLRADRICPIFEVSNVTMEGIERLMKFLNMLPLRRDWHALQSLPAEMIVDSTFFVTGVGTVVGGIVTQGIFKVNDSVLLGPDGTGQFRPTQIKSIHVKGYEVEQAECGNDAALCLRKERRNAIRKGNVLVHPAVNPKGYWQFEAEIRVLYHSTTIESNYEPVIHTPTARQAARIKLQSDEAVLRTGDTAIVRFHFLYRPEYLKIGHRIIFREGRTKGIGQVTGVFVEMDPAILGLRRTAQKDIAREKMEGKEKAGAGAGGGGGGNADGAGSGSGAPPPPYSAATASGSAVAAAAASGGAGNGADGSKAKKKSGSNAAK